MIRLEGTQVIGLDHAIRGMRNPMNSWDKSDSYLCVVREQGRFRCDGQETGKCVDGVILGDDDRKLMMRLAAGGPVHAKFRRMITVYVDITAPLYWWKEFDTYKVGTVANSCSTMHKIHDKAFTIDDFSHEHLMDCADILQLNEQLVPQFGEDLWSPTLILKMIIGALNFYRCKFLETQDKSYWWQMIQLLPSSYNQKRTVMLNYEVLSNIYQSRKNHKLDEWREVCRWIESLPYSEIITGEQKEESDGRG